MAAAGQWRRRASGGVWPAGLAHLSFNLGLSLIGAAVTTSHLRTVVMLGRESGIATLVVLGAVALRAARRPRGRARDQGSPEPTQDRSGQPAETVAR